jgi:hypothetical protein
LPGTIIRQVPFLVHLERPQHGQIDVPATDHCKRLGAAEVRTAGRFADGLLASIDQVRVDLRLGWIGPDAEHPVLRVQRDIHSGRHMIRDQRRQADAEIHVVAVVQLPRDPQNDPFPLVHGLQRLTDHDG